MHHNGPKLLEEDVGVKELVEVDVDASKARFNPGSPPLDKCLEDGLFWSWSGALSLTSLLGHGFGEGPVRRSRICCKIGDGLRSCQHGPSKMRI